MRFPILHGILLLIAASTNSVGRADGFEVWRTAQFSFSELSDSKISGENADPDGDGIPNLIEYAQARSPKIADMQAATGQGMFNNRLTLSFRERDDLGGASIWLQGSDDLIRWTTYNIRQETARIVDTGFSTVTVLDYKEQPLEGDKRFLRLRVDRTPAPLVAPDKVEVGFNSPTDLYVIWGDLNTAESGYKVTHSDNTYGYRVVAETSQDVTKVSGLSATPQTGYYFSVSTRGLNSSEIQSSWAAPSDRDGDSIPDFLERQGQTIITGTYDSSPDSWDTDGDGLSDTDEILYYNTNPGSSDTDMDGLPDGWEVYNGFNPNQIDDASADPDGDNLSNLRESQLGTNPFQADSDADGLTDQQEADVTLTNPLIADSDGDNLNDGPEVLVYHTNPLIPDTDGDGIPDGWEITYGLNPLSPNDAALDTDEDGLNNLEEYTYSISPLKADTDNDGLLDGEEVELGTNGGFWDTDSDDISDRYELDNGLLPNDYSDANSDPDSDGLSNLQEYNLGTDPHLADTDGGGLSDSAESAAGKDPTDRSDDTQSPQPSLQVDFALKIQSTGKTLVGNCAVCHNLQAQVGSRLVNDGEVIKIRRDKVYEITLIDKITQWPNNGGEPPHENSAKFTLWPIAQSGQTVTSSSNNKQITVMKSGAVEYFIENSSDLLAQEKTWNDNVLKQKALVGMADIDVMHPATGELEETKEDMGDGGYVAIKRVASTPVTQLLVHARPAFATTFYRLKFNSSGRYKLYRNAARTEEVLSEQNQFNPVTDMEFYLEGILKSNASGGEVVTVQIQQNGQWLDADSVRLTVVQAEFPMFIRAYIPYLWTTPEDIFWTTTLLTGQNVAGGDNRDLNLDPDNDNYRLMQSFTLTPYLDLHASKDIEEDRKFSSAQQSISYKRSTAVPAEDMNKLHGYSLKPNPEFRIGTPQGLASTYVVTTNGKNKTTMQVTGSGEDGAIYAASFWGGWQIPSAGVPNIDWDIKVTLDKTNALLPKVEIEGERNKFPAYEIIGLNSVAMWTEIYNWQPPLESRAGPISLNFSDEIVASKIIQ